MEITKYVDYFNSEDVDKRITELELDDNTNCEELKMLKELKTDCYCEEWKYSILFINEDYFTYYCKEFIRDVGDLPKEIPPYIERNINWSGVAEELKQDYQSTQYNNKIFYYRT